MFQAINENGEVQVIVGVNPTILLQEKFDIPRIVRFTIGEYFEVLEATVAFKHSKTENILNSDK